MSFTTNKVNTLDFAGIAGASKDREYKHITALLNNSKQDGSVKVAGRGNCWNLCLHRKMGMLSMPPGKSHGIRSSSMVTIDTTKHPADKMIRNPAKFHFTGNFNEEQSVKCLRTAISHLKENDFDMLFCSDMDKLHLVCTVTRNVAKLYEERTKVPLTKFTISAQDFIAGERIPLLPAVIMAETLLEGIMLVSTCYKLFSEEMIESITKEYIKSGNMDDMMVGTDLVASIARSLGVSEKMVSSTNIQNALQKTIENTAKAAVIPNDSRVITLPSSTDTTIISELNREFGNFQFVPSTSGTHSHPYHHAARQAITRRVVSEYPRSAVLYDIGGHLSWHAKDGHFNVHSVVSTKNYDDKSRYIRWVVTATKDAHKRLINAAASQDGSMNMTLQAKQRIVSRDQLYWCENDLNDCPHYTKQAAAFAMSVDTLYHVDIKDLCKFYVEKKIVRATHAITMPPNYWLKNEGTLAHDEGHWVKDGDTLRLVFPGESTVYEQSIKHFESLFTVPVWDIGQNILYAKVGSSVGPYVTIEHYILDKNNFVDQIFTHALWTNPKLEHMPIMIPCINTTKSKNLIGDYPFEFETFDLNLVFYEKLLNRMMQPYTWESLTAYAAATVGRSYATTQGLFPSVKINNSDLRKHCVVAYWSAAKHAEQMKPLLRKAETTQSEPGFLAMLWNSIKNYARDFFFEIDPTQWEPIQEFISSNTEGQLRIINMFGKFSHQADSLNATIHMAKSHSLIKMMLYESGVRSKLPAPNVDEWRESVDIDTSTDVHGTITMLTNKEPNYIDSGCNKKDTCLHNHNIPHSHIGVSNKVVKVGECECCGIISNLTNAMLCMVCSQTRLCTGHASTCGHAHTFINDECCNMPVCKCHKKMMCMCCNKPSIEEYCNVCAKGQSSGHNIEIAKNTRQPAPYINDTTSLRIDNEEKTIVKDSKTSEIQQASVNCEQPHINTDEEISEEQITKTHNAKPSNPVNVLVTDNVLAMEPSKFRVSSTAEIKRVHIPNFNWSRCQQINVTVTGLGRSDDGGRCGIDSIAQIVGSHVDDLEDMSKNMTGTIKWHSDLELAAIAAGLRHNLILVTPDKTTYYHNNPNDTTAGMIAHLGEHSGQLHWVPATGVVNEIYTPDSSPRYCNYLWLLHSLASGTLVSDMNTTVPASEYETVTSDAVKAWRCSNTDWSSVIDLIPGKWAMNENSITFSARPNTENFMVYAKSGYSIVDVMSNKFSIENLARVTPKTVVITTRTRGRALCLLLRSMSIDAAYISSNEALPSGSSINTLHSKKMVFIDVDYVTDLLSEHMLKKFVHFLQGYIVMVDALSSMPIHKLISVSHLGARCQYIIDCKIFDRVGSLSGHKMPITILDNYEVGIAKNLLDTSDVNNYNVYVVHTACSQNMASTHNCQYKDKSYSPHKLINRHCMEGWLNMENYNIIDLGQSDQLNVRYPLSSNNKLLHSSRGYNMIEMRRSIALASMGNCKSWSGPVVYEPDNHIKLYDQLMASTNTNVPIESKLMSYVSTLKKNRSVTLTSENQNIVLSFSDSKPVGIDIIPDINLWLDHANANLLSAPKQPQLLAQGQKINKIVRDISSVDVIVNIDLSFIENVNLEDAIRNKKFLQIDERKHVLDMAPSSYNDDISPVVCASYYDDYITGINSIIMMLFYIIETQQTTAARFGCQSISARQDVSKALTSKMSNKQPCALYDMVNNKIQFDTLSNVPKIVPHGNVLVTCSRSLNYQANMIRFWSNNKCTVNNIIKLLSSSKIIRGPPGTGKTTMMKEELGSDKIITKQSLMLKNSQFILPSQLTELHERVGLDEIGLFNISDLAYISLFAKKLIITGDLAQLTPDEDNINTAKNIGLRAMTQLMSHCTEIILDKTHRFGTNTCNVLQACGFNIHAVHDKEHDKGIMISKHDGLLRSDLEQTILATSPDMVLCFNNNTVQMVQNWFPDASVTTVARAQGSEAKRVLILAFGVSQLLTRNALYVAMTRHANECVIAADNKCISTIVRLLSIDRNIIPSLAIDSFGFSHPVNSRSLTNSTRIAGGNCHLFDFPTHVLMSLYQHIEQYTQQLSRNSEFVSIDMALCLMYAEDLLGVPRNSLTNSTYPTEALSLYTGVNQGLRAGHLVWADLVRALDLSKTHQSLDIDEHIILSFSGTYYLVYIGEDILVKMVGYSRKKMLLAAKGLYDNVGNYESTAPFYLYESTIQLIDHILNYFNELFAYGSVRKTMKTEHYIKLINTWESILQVHIIINGDDLGVNPNPYVKYLTHYAAHHRMSASELFSSMLATTNTPCDPLAIEEQIELFMQENKGDLYSISPSSHRYLLNLLSPHHTNIHGGGMDDSIKYLSQLILSIMLDMPSCVKSLASLDKELCDDKTTNYMSGKCLASTIKSYAVSGSQKTIDIFTKIIVKVAKLLSSGTHNVGAMLCRARTSLLDKCVPGADDATEPVEMVDNVTNEAAYDLDAVPMIHIPPVPEDDTVQPSVNIPGWTSNGPALIKTSQSQLVFFSTLPDHITSKDIDWLPDDINLAIHRVDSSMYEIDVLGITVTMITRSPESTIYWDVSDTQTAIDAVAALDQLLNNVGGGSSKLATVITRLLRCLRSWCMCLQDVASYTTDIGHHDNATKISLNLHPVVIEHAIKESGAFNTRSSKYRSYINGSHMHITYKFNDKQWIRLSALKMQDKSIAFVRHRGMWNTYGTLNTALSQEGSSDNFNATVGGGVADGLRMLGINIDKRTECDITDLLPQIRKAIYNSPLSELFKLADTPAYEEISKLTNMLHEQDATTNVIKKIKSLNTRKVAFAIPSGHGKTSTIALLRKSYHSIDFLDDDELVEQTMVTALPTYSMKMQHYKSKVHDFCSTRDTNSRQLILFVHDPIEVPSDYETFSIINQQASPGKERFWSGENVDSIMRQSKYHNVTHLPTFSSVREFVEARMFNGSTPRIIPSFNGNEIDNVDNIDGLHFFLNGHTDESVIRMPKEGKLSIREPVIGYDQQRTFKSCSHPGMARPTINMMWNSTINAISTRLHGATKFRDQDLGNDEYLQLLEKWLVPDYKSKIEAFEEDKIHAHVPAVVEWLVNKGNKIELLDGMVAEALTRYQGVDPTLATGHFKVETLLKENVADIHDQIGRIIVWNNQNINMFICPLVNEAKYRLKTLFNHELVTYSDGMDIVDINNKMSMMPKCKNFVELDLSKQDRQTDEPILRAEWAFMHKLGLHPDIIEYMQQAASGFTLYGVDGTRSKRPGMHFSGGAMTSLGNEFRNLFLLADITSNKQVTHVFTLGDDSLILTDDEFDEYTVGLIAAKRHNVSCTFSMRQDCGLFLQLIVGYVDGVLCASHNYFRLKEKLAYSPYATDSSNWKAKYASFLMMIGDIPEVSHRLLQLGINTKPPLGTDFNQRLMLNCMYHNCSEQEILNTVIDIINVPEFSHEVLITDGVGVVRPNKLTRGGRNISSQRSDENHAITTLSEILAMV